MRRRMRAVWRKRRWSRNSMRKMKSTTRMGIYGRYVGRGKGGRRGEIGLSRKVVPQRHPLRIEEGGGRGRILKYWMVEGREQGEGEGTGEGRGRNGT